MRTVTTLTPQQLSTHYARLARLWPHDPLRAVSLPLALQRRRERLLASPSSTDTTSGTTASNASAPAGSAMGRNLSAEAEGQRGDEAAQVNALYGLLENRYTNMYKCSADLLAPPSKPTHYAALAAELEAAPGRTWLQRQWLRWSRIVRFS